MTTYTMPADSLGHPLPDLRSAGDCHAHAAIEIDETTVTPEEARYMGWGRINTILSYTLQDGYIRTKRRRVSRRRCLKRTSAGHIPAAAGRASLVAL